MRWCNDEQHQEMHISTHVSGKIVRVSIVRLDSNLHPNHCPDDTRSSRLEASLPGCRRFAASMMIWYKLSPDCCARARVSHVHDLYRRKPPECKVETLINTTRSKPDEWANLESSLM
jgi:hypothetical protein